MPKKDCWEWIFSKIDKKEKQLKKPANIYLKFLIFEDGKVTYIIGTVKANKDYKISFTADEILSCESVAKENGLVFDVWNAPDDNPIQAITFSRVV